MFWNKYPYTDYHELNLDWVIGKIREIYTDFTEFKALNTITIDGEWDITKQYKAWTIVSYQNKGYISLKPVPAGITIDNADYWTMIADYEILINDLTLRVEALEDKTIMDYTGDGEVFPSDNPAGDQREYLVFRVPSSVNKFVDNVIGIQNKSHGPIGGNPDAYGNAAIAFFDGAQIERGAVGYSRENSIQPSGYIPNTLYIEVGNPFGAAGTDTDFRVIATNSTNFPNTSFYPFEHISQTGATNIRGRGNALVNLYGGVKVDNPNSTFAKLYEGGLIVADRCGLAYNIASGETGTKIDNSKNAYFFTVGAAYDIAGLDKTYEGFTYSISGANDSDVYTLWNLDYMGKIYHGRYNYNSWAFNGINNTSNYNLKTVPAMCLNNDSTNQPAEIIWNSSTSDSYIEFQYGATISASSLKGSIKYNTGTGQINYNTTSDYRVKKISGEVENAVDIIKNIKVYNGTIGEATEESAFCIAHELQEIYSPCVTGEKDAIDENGNAILQQVDYSKLIPIIIKALQEVIK